VSARKDKPIEFDSAKRSPDPAPGAASDVSQEPNALPDVQPVDEYTKLLAEKQELTNTLLRRQADFENYRKRVEKERHQERQRAVEALIEQLLPVLDAFDLALNGADDGASAEYRKGFELIRRRLWDALAKQGLVRVDSVGKEFSPHLHHAIGRVETSEYADGTVVEELQPGYMFQERVLRPAMVRVASAPDAESGRITLLDN
jgi:molecular chaperone GrpE